jgi:hypothetical protein
MIYNDKITKKSNLEKNDSLTIYDGKWSAQQNPNAFESFFYFLKEIRPKRILEIGSATGGFTFFLKETVNNLGLECDILSFDIFEYPAYEELRNLGVDIRIENIFDENYSNVSQYVKDYILSDGLTLILCDGGNKKEEFKILSQFMKEGDFILGHDYSYDEVTFEEKINKKIWNWLELTEKDISETCVNYNLIDYRRDVFESIVWICKTKVPKEKIKEELSYKQNNNENQKVTFVTGLWDIKRDSLKDGWSRSYDHYLTKFDELLKIDTNLIIFGDSELEKFVFERRKKHNTQFILRDLEWFKTTVPFEKIQKIRKDKKWIKQSEWMSDSTQAKLEWYNPLVMSKMFLLHDAKILDKFDSEYMFWIDAGITNTVHLGYFTHDNVQNKLNNYFDKFSFICFPYEAQKEIHGFTYPKINQYANDDVKLVARGGFFGGKKQSISDVNSIYYSILQETLSDGYMGTEESIFSIMVYKFGDQINYFEILENGLINTFFENLKNGTLEKKTKGTLISNYNIEKASLYVIGFNSPNQFETLILSMIEYDKNFIDKPKKYLLNNSTDESTFQKYSEICDLHDFTMISPKENLGICGGRQFIAEHFESSDSDFMFFFEDDMFFYYNKKEWVCRNGFNRIVDGLYEKSLKIIQKENFDFLKLNFSEFFGDNSVQWSWYNVPQNVREKFWPENCKLPEHGLSSNAPKTVFNHIKSLEGVPYVDGEIYYCNWPQIVSREGNKKMFIDTKWAYPYEQTWMSHMFQETKKNNLKPGMLLLTPTEHNRFEHYGRDLRKES